MSEFIFTITAGLNCNADYFFDCNFCCSVLCCFCSEVNRWKKDNVAGAVTPPPACGKTTSGGSECKHGKIIYSNDAADISWAKERIRWVLSQQGVEGGTLLAAPTVNSLAAAITATAAAATRRRSKTVNRRGFEFVTASLVWGGINPRLRSSDTH